MHSKLGAALLFGLVACSSTEHQAGVEVEVVFAPVAATTTFDSDLGYSVSLSEGYLTLGAVEIEPCESLVSLTDWPFALFAAQPAYAHGSSTPTRLESPRVFSFGAGEAEVVSLGSLEPPAGRFCAASIELSPADSHATNLPTGMEGRALWLRGSYRRGGEAAVPFELSSDRATPVERGLELALSAENSPSRLALTLAPETLFDGVDFAGTSSATWAGAVLENVRASVLSASFSPSSSR